ncbi:hypothetical protein [Streptomyces sp. NPDC002671]
MSEQLADERTEAGSPVVQVAGRAVRQAAGPVSTRQIGEVLGLDTGVRGKLEPLRGKPTKLADRGWLHKRPDGKFTTRP